MTRRLSILLVLGGAVVLATCHSAEGPFAAGTRLANGTWGGNDVALIATDSLTHVHVGCTFGDFPGDVQLDAQGRFSVAGSYVLRAYPVAVGPTLPAQISGQVVGTTLTFAIAVNDTVQHQLVALGPDAVVLGKEPVMGICPVCRLPALRRRFRNGASMAAKKKAKPSPSNVIPDVTKTMV